MAGFLGIGNYSKPGPGVSKDEPQKHGFFVFFELYFRKFWKLIEINMLFFICCVPFVILVFLLMLIKLPVVVAWIPIIGVAVMAPGLTYVLRNFARQENAFLWMDFRDTVKSNWRQSLAVGAVDFVVYLVMYFAIAFYHAQLAKSVWFVMLLAVCAMIAVIFTFMQYYIMLLLITFKLKIKEIFKNAFIFAFAGLGYNLLATLFCGVLALIVYIFFPISLILVPFVLISTAGFIIVFNAWPVIDKFMMPKKQEEEDDGALFEDIGRQS